MKATPSTARPRPIIYVLVLVAIGVIVVLVARSTPSLLTASQIPYLALFLLCPIAMFFMMRGMNGRAK
jgi:hypothetical protein